MNSSEPMSRRRFLVVVGGAGGALGVAGLGGWRLLGGGDSSVPTAGRFAVDPGVEIVEVEPGFVDATAWNDELLTLRASNSGTGIVLRSETTGTDHPVDVPDGFAARCVGVIDDTIIIGGHRHIETNEVAFATGADYGVLLRRAGLEADLLLSQPSRPIAASHDYRPVERVATVITASNLVGWAQRDVHLPSGTGGSVAAVLEQSSSLALDRYAYSDYLDSVFEASFLSVISAVPDPKEDLSHRSLPIDHGSIWGVVSDYNQELIVIEDRSGTVCYDHRNNVVFSIQDGSELLGIQLRAGQPLVSVVDANGVQETRAYYEGREIERRPIGDVVAHQISPRLTVAAEAGKAAAVFAEPI